MVNLKTKQTYKNPNSRRTEFVRRFDNANAHSKFLAIGPFPNYRKHPSNIPCNALKKSGSSESK